MSTKYTKFYKNAVPVTLFRMSLAGQVKLRKYAGSGAGDVWVEGAEDIVKPNPEDQAKYRFPNGASMRPAGPNQLKLAKTFKGSNVALYKIPENTPLPSDLVLVHETGDHFSLQPAKPMKLDVFNAKVEAFYKSTGSLIQRTAWLMQYAPPKTKAGPNGEKVEWSTTEQSWFYKDKKTGKSVTVS